MRFAVLGSIEARQDGTALPLGGPKQRALLAILLLEANRVVSRDRLIDRLWGERPPPTAGRTLDNYISRLRKVLGSERVVRRAPGYLVVVADEELDLNRFERLLEAGRAELADGNAAAAAGTLREALGTWRGTPLADLLYEPFAAEEVARLEERRVIALEERLEADLALGRSSELVVELEELVRRYPMRERLLAQLMLAQYRAGRQTAALATYRAARARLADELGLEPGPGLQRLERQILQHDVEIAGPPPAAAAQASATLRARWLPAAAIVAALAVATAAGLAILSSRGAGPAAVASATGNQLIHLDARSGRAGAASSIGGTPAAIASGAGSLWMADTGHNALLRANSVSGTVVDRIPLGVQPGAVAVGHGSVWVAGTAGATVTRIDDVTDEVTQTIHLGGNSSGIVFSQGALWATDRADEAVLRIDPASGNVMRTTTVGVPPSAIVAGGGLIWIASYDTGTVAAVDPRRNTLVETVHVGQGPAALCFGAGALWVANKLDGTVSRVDPRAARVTRTISTGSAPAGIAFADGSVWVANEFSRTVSLIDPASGAVAATVAVGGDPVSLHAAGHTVWVGTRPRVEHRGGTLVLLDRLRFNSIDPQVDYEATPAQFLGLVNDGLVAYDHTGGPDGLHLVPDLALSLPVPADGNRSYTFQLRPGLRYSNGGRVLASDFARAMVRIFRVGSPGAGFFSHVIGAQTCLSSPARCDLSHGVVADDPTRTIRFDLDAADPDFLFKLALGFVVPIPPGTPMHDVGSHPIPGTGPYEFGTVGRQAITFVRNPRFHEWSHAAQPDGNPDRLVWRFGRAPDEEARDVMQGRGDWTGDFPSDLGTLARRDSSAVRSNAFPTTLFLQVNTRLRPFSDVRVRRALNYAVDRAAFVRLYGGPIANAPTCQIIPPGLPGHRDYCPYTLAPAPSGNWTAPDLPRARALVAASGMRGTRVTLWSVSDSGSPEPGARYLVSLLRRLGFRAGVQVLTSDQNAHASRSAAQLGLVDFGPDYPSAAEIFALFLACDTALSSHQFCDPAVDRATRLAEALRLSDPVRSASLWARLDRELVDRAVWVPLVTQRIVDIVSPRLRNYEFSPVYHFMPAQAWLR